MREGGTDMDCRMRDASCSSQLVLQRKPFDLLRQGGKGWPPFGRWSRARPDGHSGPWPPNEAAFDVCNL
jgi:hypothetical protein